MTEQFYRLEEDDLCEASKKLTKCEMTLYFYLQLKSWRQTKIYYVNFSELGETLGFTKSTVSRAFQVLINHDWIKSEWFPRQNITYSSKTDSVAYTKRKMRDCNTECVHATQDSHTQHKMRTRNNGSPVHNHNSLESTTPIESQNPIDVIDKKDPINAINQNELKTNFSSNGFYEDDDGNLGSPLEADFDDDIPC